MEIKIMDTSKLDIRSRQMTIGSLLQRGDNFTLAASWAHEIQAGLPVPGDEWDSRVIESLLIPVPIGNMWLVDGKMSCVSILADGRRRLAAIRRFAQKQFALTGLKLAPELNGLYHSELKPYLRLVLLQTDVPVTVIGASTPVDVAVEVLSQALSRPAHRYRMASSIGKIHSAEPAAS
jgi:hypothetical protein